MDNPTPRRKWEEEDTSNHKSALPVIVTNMRVLLQNVQATGTSKRPEEILFSTCMGSK